MKKNFLFFLLGITLLSVSSCKKDNDDKDDDDETPISTPQDPVTDIDGNVYKVVKIGDQIWMAENLKATRYNNGDSINIYADNTPWKSATDGAACYFDNNVAMRDTFGMLYNYHALTGSRNPCPTGWRVSTAQDWLTLIETMGGIAVAGQKLKSDNRWDEEDGSNSNTVGFNAYPAGRRDQNGGFSHLGRNANFWTTENLDNEKAWIYRLGKTVAEVFSEFEVKLYGYSCRCVKN